MTLRVLLISSLQWLSIVVPILVIGGNIVSEILGPDQTQKIFFISGITILLQIFFGHKLPLIVGPSAILIAAIYSTSAEIEAIYTSILACGIVLSLLSVTGKVNYMLKFFSERITALVFILVAISLTPLILDMVKTLYDFIFLTTFAFLLFILNKIIKIIKPNLILFGLILGSLIHLTIFPREILVPALEFSIFSIEFKPVFRLEVMMTFFICFLALALNDLSSIYSTGEFLKSNKLDLRTKRGLSITALSNSLSGILGTVGTVNFTISPGVINLIKNPSRFALVPVGFILVSLSFTNLSSIFEIVPKAVIASIFLYLIISQVAAVSSNVKIKDFYSGIVFAFPVILAITITFLPEEVVEPVPSPLKPILSNSFTVSLLLAIMLERLR